MTDREVMKMALDDLVTLVDDLRRIPSDIAQTIAALRTALAQPEQSKYSDLISDGGLDPRNKFDAQQEPVAWLVSDAQGRYATIRDPAPYGEEVYEPLYAAPPKREWVGLTVEERRRYNDRLSGSGVAEEIETKLKEKNGGV